MNVDVIKPIYPNQNDFVFLLSISVFSKVLFSAR